MKLSFVVALALPFLTKALEPGPPPMDFDEPFCCLTAASANKEFDPSDFITRRRLDKVVLGDVSQLGDCDPCDQDCLDDAGISIFACVTMNFYCDFFDKEPCGPDSCCTGDLVNKCGVEFENTGIGGEDYLCLPDGSGNDGGGKGDPHFKVS